MLSWQYPTITPAAFTERGSTIIDPVRPLSTTGCAVWLDQKAILFPDSRDEVNPAIIFPFGPIKLGVILVPDIF